MEELVAAAKTVFVQVATYRQYEATGVVVLRVGHTSIQNG
jgi:hypothetical protein